MDSLPTKSRTFQWRLSQGWVAALHAGTARTSELLCTPALAVAYAAEHRSPLWVASLPPFYGRLCE